jgi:hypothetical protein
MTAASSSRARPIPVDRRISMNDEPMMVVT